MKTLITAFVLTIFVSPAMSSEVQRPHSWGLYWNSIEGNESAFGIIYMNDFSAVDRFFVSLERGTFTDTQFFNTRDYDYGYYVEADVTELELGYLRRLTAPGRQGLNLFAGPSIGFQEGRGSFDTAYIDRRGTYRTSGDIETDVGVNLYANLMLEARSNNGVFSFIHFSYGYSLGTEVTYITKSGGSGSETYKTDSNTFWNLAFGFGLAF